MKTHLLTTLLTCFLMTQALANAAESQTTSEIDDLMEKVELIPIMVNGDKHNRINVVLMNRWTERDSEPYNAEAMRDEFIQDIKDSLIAALTPGDERAQTAYANYRAFFNVYGLWYPDSPEWNKGIRDKTVDALRDRLFLPWKDDYRGWVTFLVMPNRNGGGGGAARNLEKRVGTALIAGNSIPEMLHEIAHTCMSIGDEYTAAATGTSAVPTYAVTKEYRRDKIKWRKWIEPDTPLPTPYTEEYKDRIGAFEGAQYHLTDYFRSSAQGCIMGAGVFDNTQRMCPICQQRVAMRVYTLVNPINSFAPAKPKIDISGETTVHFEIDHIRPEPNTQVVRWILNGKTIATGVDEIDVTFGALRHYTLACSLTDETPFIRPDPPYAKYPKHEIQWQISNSSPTSRAKALRVDILPFVSGNGSELQAAISGGTPPYRYLWSNGSTEQAIKQVEPGLHELCVIDGEFRQAKSSHLICADSAAKNTAATSTGLSLDVEVTAADQDKDNGQLSVAVKGGAAPYRFEWSDVTRHYNHGHVYEAEVATVNIPDHVIRTYSDASNNTFIDFNKQEGDLTWVVYVAKPGPYPIEVIYGGVAEKGTSMALSVNGQPVAPAVAFASTRPQYTGWETVAVTAELAQGVNRVTLRSTGASGVNVDYLRVSSCFEAEPVTGFRRRHLAPGDYTVTVSDGQDHVARKTVTVPEVYPFEISPVDIKTAGKGTLAIVDPLAGYDYLWYQAGAPLFAEEQDEVPLGIGTEFQPPAPGTYYVAAKNRLTQAHSRNRIGFAVDQKPKANHMDDINPASKLRDRIKLWFDASDLDGDGNQDGIVPERGPLKEWTARTWRHRGKIFAKYKPNTQNGLGVCGFDHAWISSLGTEIEGFQTLVLVYRESSMTLPGKAPLRGLNKYIGKSAEPQQRLFDADAVDEKTKQAKVYLDGRAVDPFNTPNPMTFCVLTVAFESPIKDRLAGAEGYFEGDVAEMLFIDGTLSQEERLGVEEYLRKKWFSTVDLRF